MDQTSVHDSYGVYGDQNGEQLPEIFAFHGWGFDRHCWQFWRQQFTGLGCKFQAFDRGYFGNPHQPSFTDSDAPKIILIHSFGLHLCPIDLLQQADILIAFNSFLSFHPEPKAEKRRSKLVLQQMIRQFEQTPEVVLQNFYLQAGYAQRQDNVQKNVQKIDVQKIDVQLLLQDLQHLNNAELPGDYLRSIDKIIVFQSSDDRIVVASQTQELLTAFPHSCQLIHILHSGHALPFTHPTECWSMIQPILYSSVAS